MQTNSNRFVNDMSMQLIIPAELHLVFAYLKARKHVKKSVVSLVMYVGDFTKSQTAFHKIVGVMEF